MFRSLVSALILVVVPQSLSAQLSVRKISGPAPSVLFRVEQGAPAPLMTGTGIPDSVRSTHWERGLWIGAGAGGFALGLFANALCRGLDETHQGCFKPTVVGGLMGATIGGAIGALIGGQFRKTRRVVPDSAGVSP